MKKKKALFLIETGLLELLSGLEPVLNNYPTPKNTIYSIIDFSKNYILCFYKKIFFTPQPHPNYFRG